MTDATRAIVIALSADGTVFAVETEDGVAAVFYQRNGPRLQAGDMLAGEVTGSGTQLLVHPDGVCTVVADSGPVARQEALTRVNLNVAAPRD